MIELALTTDGVLLPVRVSPGARRTAVLGVHARRLKVAVAAAPERGKANQAVRHLLAEVLSLRPADIELWQGAASPTKVFLIRIVSRDELQARLKAVLDETTQ